MKVLALPHIYLVFRIERKKKERKKERRKERKKEGKKERKKERHLSSEGGSSIVSYVPRTRYIVTRRCSSLCITSDLLPQPVTDFTTVGHRVKHSAVAFV